MNPVPAYILGGSGFAAAELLRLLFGHPGFYVAGVVSSSSSEKPIGEIHPHLASAYPGLQTTSWDSLKDADLPDSDTVAVFSALPHGLSGDKVKFLTDLFPKQTKIHVVDLSADFRYASVDTFEEIYKTRHPAPDLVPSFGCALPEHAIGSESDWMAHPGCFTTSVVLGAAPLVDAGFIGNIRVSAVTGSTGSGRNPKPTTHHPLRANNMFAYKPFVHRHRQEMELLINKATGREIHVSFAPQSGAFARGIYTTIFADNLNGVSAETLTDHLANYYRSAPFITVRDTPPRLKDVVGTNQCHLAVQSDDHSIVIFSAIDNLIKGASGGGIQWMNRLLGYEETTGLLAPGLGWI